MIRCDVAWLRLTDGSAWTHQCTDTRHFRVEEMHVFAGQKPRAMPEDFPAMLELLKNNGQLTKHYRCRDSVITRWRKELHEKD
jgi:hypothetical protein